MGRLGLTMLVFGLVSVLDCFGWFGCLFVCAVWNKLADSSKVCGMVSVA